MQTKVSTHVETVVLLSKGVVDKDIFRKVKVDFSLEEMDLSEFKGNATYEQVKAYVLEQTGLKVSSLYIAQIKKKCGLDVWMPYIVEMNFEGKNLISIKELAHVEKDYQKIDFATITACGECCIQCSRKISGECLGCIEADGIVPEWKESGRCKIHTCVHENGVQFCGLCKSFPCDNIAYENPAFWILIKGAAFAP